MKKYICFIIVLITIACAVGCSSDKSSDDNYLDDLYHSASNELLRATDVNRDSVQRSILSRFKSKGQYSIEAEVSNVSDYTEYRRNMFVFRTAPDKSLTRHQKVKRVFVIDSVTYLPDPIYLLEVTAYCH